VVTLFAARFNINSTFCRQLYFLCFLWSFQEMTMFHNGDGVFTVRYGLNRYFWHRINSFVLGKTSGQGLRTFRWSSVLSEIGTVGEKKVIFRLSSFNWDDHGNISTELSMLMWLPAWTAWSLGFVHFLFQRSVEESNMQDAYGEMKVGGGGGS